MCLSVCAGPSVQFERCWLMTWSWLGHISRFLHSNDIPQCVCCLVLFWTDEHVCCTIGTSFLLLVNQWDYPQKQRQTGLKKKIETPEHCVHISFRKGGRKFSHLDTWKTMTAVWWVYYIYGNTSQTSTGFCYRMVVPDWDYFQYSHHIEMNGENVCKSSMKPGNKDAVREHGCSEIDTENVTYYSV